MKLWKRWKIRAADRAARHLHDRVAVILDLRIGDGVAPNVFLTVPNERPHAILRDAVGHQRRLAMWVAKGCP